MISPDSLAAETATGARRTFDSWQSGWRHVLLRQYAEPLTIDDFATSVTRDQKLVLVTRGGCRIEAYRDGVWHGAEYRPGHVGLVPPGEAARLRWRGPQRHHTLQLHLPGALIEGVAQQLYGSDQRQLGALNCLSLIDPVVSTAMLAIAHAARSGAPDLHGETAAHFLASHLLLRTTRSDTLPDVAPGMHTLRRVEDFMLANLSRSLTLGELAAVAGMNRFRFLRAAKRAWGETPMRRLTRLRMEGAQRLLLSRQLNIIEIALECGYANPAHFATAFRRFHGLSPSEYSRRA